ncbi:MAG: glycosyl hydrolase [Bacteroidota bacterium]
MFNSTSSCLFPAISRFPLFFFFVFTLPLLGQQAPKAKFEPPAGKCLLFVGQDLGAVGGLDDYDDGYLDHFPPPTGITTYTNLSPGGESFGYYFKGLDGLKTKANWGAGDICAQCQLEDPDFKHSLLAIGLSLVNHEKAIGRGQRDDLIRELATWIKSLGGRPVFLRVGYEFDGWAWNHYERKHYLRAWRRIHTIFREKAVDNVAFVWQSKGTGSDQALLDDWYPGDDLVDWVGYSYFGSPDQEMLTFARRHGKPVFIAEATPVRETDGLFFNTRLSDPEIAQTVWDQWFATFFATLHDNADVIKAISYINANWPAQPMWLNNPVFQQVDARLQVSGYVRARWLESLNGCGQLSVDEQSWSMLKKGRN